MEASKAFLINSKIPSVNSIACPVKSLKIELLNPLDKRDWDGLLSTVPHPSFFHTSAWARVLYRSYGYRAFYFGAVENGKLCALIPVMEVDSFLTGKRGVSLPFTDISEPYASVSDFFRAAFQFAADYGRHQGWKFIELRGDNCDDTFQNPSTTFYVHTLNLRHSESEILKSFRSSTKRNIKKAVKEGIQIEIDTSLESVKKFYDLNCRTRKKHGLPPQPFKFFRNIFDCVLKEKQGLVILAIHQGKPIAGAVYFHFGKEAVYKYGASDEKYLHLRANNLVMWTAIQYYLRQGFERFHFGRTGINNSGLRQFKNGWGTEEKILKYYKYNLSNEKFVTSSLQIPTLPAKLLQILPLSILKLAGMVLYKHIG